MEEFVLIVYIDTIMRERRRCLYGENTCGRAERGFGKFMILLNDPNPGQ